MDESGGRERQYYQRLANKEGVKEVKKSRNKGSRRGGIPGEVIKRTRTHLLLMTVEYHSNLPSLAWLYQGRLAFAFSSNQWHQINRKRISCDPGKAKSSLDWSSPTQPDSANHSWSSALPNSPQHRLLQHSMQKLSICAVLPTPAQQNPVRHRLT